MDTTDSELNRVLEAVLFPSLILLGGEPGIGKHAATSNFTKITL
jgi:predicted ATP-dependent serine protease